MGLCLFTAAIFADLVNALEDTAVQTDKGHAVAEAAVQVLRSWRVLLPAAEFAALAIESEATVTDEVIELHDRILGKMFNQAKNRHRDTFHDAGKDINDKVLLFSKIGELLVTAREKGTDRSRRSTQCSGGKRSSATSRKLKPSPGRKISIRCRKSATATRCSAGTPPNCSTC